MKMLMCYKSEFFYFTYWNLLLDWTHSADGRPSGSSLQVVEEEAIEEEVVEEEVVEEEAVEEEAVEKEVVEEEAVEEEGSC
jgi:hypothetical protein